MQKYLLLPFIYTHILFDTVYQCCTFRYKSIRSMNLQIMTQVLGQSKSLIFVMTLFLITVQKHVTLLHRAFRYSFFSQDKEVAIVFPGSFVWLIIIKKMKICSSSYSVSQASCSSVITKDLPYDALHYYWHLP